MALGIFIAVELSLILVALGFLLESQSNSTVSTIVAFIVILIGFVCLLYAVSGNIHLPSKEVPVFSSGKESHVRMVDAGRVTQTNLYQV